MRKRTSRVPSADISNELRDFLDRFDRRVPNDNLTATTTPTVNDDHDNGYDRGSHWVVNGVDVYFCADSTVGAAVWKKIS